MAGDLPGPRDPQASLPPTPKRARTPPPLVPMPRHLEFKFGLVNGAWRPRVAGGGRSLRR